MLQVQHQQHQQQMINIQASGITIPQGFFLHSAYLDWFETCFIKVKEYLYCMFDIQNGRLSQVDLKAMIALLLYQ